MLVKANRYKLKERISDLTLTQIHAMMLINKIWGEIEEEATKK